MTDATIRILLRLKAVRDLLRTGVPVKSCEVFAGTEADVLAEPAPSEEMVAVADAVAGPLLQIPTRCRFV